MSWFDWLFGTKEIAKLNTELSILKVSYDTLLLNYNQLKDLTESTKNQNLKMILELQNKISDLESLIESIKSEITVEWTNPYGWTNYNGDYDIITGLSIPANTCISINDRNIKVQAMKLKGKDINETALNIEAWIYRNIVYYFDQDNNFHKGFIEWWQQASFTFAARAGDCDDMALLFNTMMHQLGYGDKVITDAGICVFPEQGNVGHAYNRVLINNEWVIFDPTNGISNRKTIEYPSMRDEWFKLNYWNVFNP